MKRYNSLEIEVISFAEEDIVRTSIQDVNDSITDVGSDIFFI